MKSILSLALSSALIFSTGCAYHFGLSERTLPGGYTQIAIPMFKNKTSEVGIEPLFTNSIIRQFNRSSAARVIEKETAPVVLEGTILTIEANQDSAVDNKGLLTLPTDAVLINEYRIVVTAELAIRRRSDDRIIWTGRFSNEKIYQPPYVGTAIVNSADSTYNHNGRLQTISTLADAMMAEAHDRITENY